MRMSSLSNSAFKWIARIFVPGLAEQMKREGSFALDDGASSHVDLEHVTVEDRGADMTIFVFSGLAVLFAGMPRFEFRKLLIDGGRQYNLVFFRDMRRMAYRMTPDGKPEGYSYYENLVNELKTKLGAKYNVALGASSGGSAAFYFGSRCNMDKIIAFSPAFPITCYTAFRTQIRTYFNFLKLLREPSAYIEVVLVTLGALVAYRRVAAVCPDIDLNAGPLKAYLKASPRPRATILYGERCAPDTDQATRAAQTPGIKIIPVNSGRHNCAADLKKQGKLGETILSEIEDVRNGT